MQPVVSLSFAHAPAERRGTLVPELLERLASLTPRPRMNGDITEELTPV